MSMDKHNQYNVILVTTRTGTGKIYYTLSVLIDDDDDNFDILIDEILYLHYIIIIIYC